MLTLARTSIPKTTGISIKKIWLDTMCLLLLITFLLKLVWNKFPISATQRAPPSSSLVLPLCQNTTLKVSICSWPWLLLHPLPTFRPPISANRPSLSKRLKPLWCTSSCTIFSLQCLWLWRPSSFSARFPMWKTFASTCWAWSWITKVLIVPRQDRPSSHMSPLVNHGALLSTTPRVLTKVPSACTITVTIATRSYTVKSTPLWFPLRSSTCQQPCSQAAWTPWLTPQTWPGSTLKFKTMWFSQKNTCSTTSVSRSRKTWATSPRTL